MLLNQSQGCIVDDDITLSIGEVESQADCVAAAWLERGVPRGAAVGVRMRPRHEWFVIHRAIAKISGVHVALNWRLLPAELNKMLKGCSLAVLVLDDPDAGNVMTAIAPGRFRCVVHFGQRAGLPGVDFDSLLLEPQAAPLFPKGDTPPLMFFTSGTTGLPKAVVRSDSRNQAERRQLQEYKFDVMRRRYGLVRHRRELLTLPLHHGMGPLAAEVCLKQGGALYILRQFDAGEALRMLCEHQITSWSCVPTMLYRIAELSPALLKRYRPRDLAFLNVGAAYFSPTLKEWAINYFGRCVSEGYGLTETGPVTGISGEESLARLDSCGKPFRHVQLRIVDEAGRECASGEVGELYVKTPLVSQDDPFVTDDGFFSTGDIARVDADGYLSITGRLKDVIVSGGVKIFPREVEDVLTRHPDVLDAAVIGVPDPEFGERVLAVCEQSGALKDGELRIFARS
ncbi:MAG: class I adenylate-forming enzyme family protein, partial [Algiphilus sp.]